MLGCAQMCEDVHRYVCVGVVGCAPMCAGMGGCVRVFTDVRCARIYIGMRGCARMCEDVHWYVWVCSVHRCALVCTLICILYHSYTNFLWNILSTLCISFRAGWFSYLGRFCREFDKRDEFRNRSIGLIVGLLLKVCVGNVES